MEYQEQYKKVLLSDPHCILGKKGITEEFTAHVLKLLKRYKIIKVKALRSVGNKQDIRKIAMQISELTNSQVLDIRGRIFILKKL